MKNGKSRRDERSFKGQRRPQKFDLPGDYTQPRKRPAGSTSPLLPKTDAQKSYINAINVYDIVFSTGPAGTGKTYIAAVMAADAFADGQIDKIIVTRPAVEAEEKLGFLPGEINEKVAPYFAPVLTILEQRLGAGKVEYLIEKGDIEFMPLAFMRGHTFTDCWVLFDEAQNCTPNQMELLLTRIGENAKIIVDGDPARQKDIEGISGLADAVQRFKNNPRMGYVEFELDDVVRSGLAKEIVYGYANRGLSNRQGELWGHSAQPLH